MKTKTNLDIGSLVKRWERAFILGNEADYIRAKIGREIYDICPTPEIAWRALVEPLPGGLGLHKLTATMVRSMAAAIRIVDDRRVWLAGGWRVVRALAGMGAKERSKHQDEVLSTAMGGRMSNEEVRVFVTTTPRRCRLLYSWLSES